MSEADALRFHHPFENVTPLSAGSEAVPEVGFRSYDQARRFIRMKLTKADEALPVRLQDDASRFREALNGNFPLYSLDFFLWNSGHSF